MKKITMILFTVLCLSACVTHIEIRGNKPDKETVEELSIGMSQKDVVKLIGSPSIIPPFCEDTTWMYIGSKMTRRAFFDTKEQERQVLVLIFDTFGNIKEIETKEMPDGMNVAFSMDKTPTLGQNFGVLKQILGNIGRFNTETKK